MGRGVKEIYAFFFRTDRVQLIRDVQTIDDRSDSFIREPAIASFISGSFDFTLVSIHVLFGNSKDERRQEISYLDDVMELVLQTDAGEQDIILVGDFNMDGQDHSWEMAGYRPLVSPDQKTTITDTSSYDNIWLSEEHTFESEYLRFGEIYPFDEQIFRDDDRQASLMVSDHRPISAWFSTDRDDDYHSDWGEVAYAFTPQDTLRNRKWSHPFRMTGSTSQRWSPHRLCRRVYACTTRPIVRSDSEAILSVIRTDRIH